MLGFWQAMDGTNQEGALVITKPSVMSLCWVLSKADTWYALNYHPRHWNILAATTISEK
jgi:hypothetical protein